MPVRDLQGREIPVGKVTRELTYDGLVTTRSAEWMQLVGAATERKETIDTGRGELVVGVEPGDLGGYAFPAFDPESFRELRISIAFRTANIGADTRVSLGIAESQGIAPPDAWAFYKEAGTTDAKGRISVGSNGEESTTDIIGIAVQDKPACSVLEVRIRPFERGITVAYGGADRGNVAFQDADLPMGLDSPMHPKLLVDATDASTGTTDRTGTDQPRQPYKELALATVRLAYVHD